MVSPQEQVTGNCVTSNQLLLLCLATKSRALLDTTGRGSKTPSRLDVLTRLQALGALVLRDWCMWLLHCVDADRRQTFYQPLRRPPVRFTHQFHGGWNQDEADDGRVNQDRYSEPKPQ